MITLTSYWMGRDKKYPADFTHDIQKHGLVTLTHVNALLDMYALETGNALATCASGWRPRSVNESTSNAGKNSKHIAADACDVLDVNRELAQWCVSNPDKLAECGLWMEDPRWTFSDAGNHWVHLQTVPPASGKRVYIPSMAQPRGPALVGQRPVPMSRKL